MKIPNLYLLGFQKCGSSTLFDMLCQHPDICGTNPKETYVLTDKNYTNHNELFSIRNGEDVWDKFVPKNSSKYVLEATVANFYQKTAFDYISSLDDVKCIFIIRNPLQRLVSNYKYYYGKINGIDSTTSFSDYIENIENNVYTIDSMKYALEHGLYSNYLKKWENVLGSKMIVIRLEDLINSTDKTMSKLYKYLELDEISSSLMMQKNKSYSVKYSGLNKLLVKLFSNTILSNKYTIYAYSLFFLKNKKVEIKKDCKIKLMNYYSDVIDQYYSDK